jgi:hypothetical protein
MSPSTLRFCLKHLKTTLTPVQPAWNEKRPIFLKSKVRVWDPPLEEQMGRLNVVVRQQHFRLAEDDAAAFDDRGAVLGAHLSGAAKNITNIGGFGRYR